MSTANTTWVLNLSENIIPKFKSMQYEGEKAGEKIAGAFNRAESSLEKASKSGGKLGDCFKRIKAMDWYAVSNGVQSLSDKLTQATQPGVKFDTQLHELKAITGATDEQMQQMAESARKLSKEFGGSGADQLSSYQSILSKLGPQIAENNEALANMGKYTQTLSKTMKGDVAGATDALTNSLIQFKVNLNDPIEAAKEMDRMMNVMTASAQVGSVEVPGISKALSDAGGTAKMFNLTFEETNAMLQGMAKGGVEIEKLGIASRNVMLKMAAPSTLSRDALGFLKQYQVDMSKVSDTTIPFAERLKELSKVGNDLDALAAIFGNENVQGAQALISTIQYQEDLTRKVTGTTAAYDMAAENMSSWAERMSRWRAVIDDWKVSLFNATAPIIPFVQGGAAMLATGADMANIYSGLSPVFSSLVGWLGKTAMAQKLLSVWTGINTTMTAMLSITMWSIPVVWLVAGIAALVAIVITCWNKFEGFRKVIFQSWEVMKMLGTGIKDFVINRFKELLSGITGIGSALLAFFKGDWQTAWDIGKKAVFDLSGAGSAEKFTNHVKNGLNPALSAGEKRSDEYTASKFGQKTNPKVDNSQYLKDLDKARAEGFTGGEGEYAAWKKEQNKKKTNVSNISPNSILNGDGKGKTKATSGNRSGATANNETSISGNGGGVKNINVKVEMKNYFNVAKGYGNIQNIADQVVGKINDRLMDATAAMG